MRRISNEESYLVALILESDRKVEQIEIFASFSWRGIEMFSRGGHLWSIIKKRTGEGETFIL